MGGKGVRSGVKTCGSDARWASDGRGCVYGYEYIEWGAGRKVPIVPVRPGGLRVTAWVEPGGESGDFAMIASFFSLAMWANGCCISR